MVTAANPTDIMNLLQTSYAMDIKPSSISGMNLPNEILLLTFQRLNKSNLKMARLVCKLWASMANPILFDKVFVSPNQLQMEVFANIAGHPIFSHTVKTLVYSTLRFDTDISVRSYIARLFSHIRGYLPHHVHWNEDKTSPQHPDPDIVEVLSYVHGIRLEAAPSTSMLLLKSELLKRGLSAYKRAGKDQDAGIVSGEFLARLCLGLSKLPRVVSLQFSSTWTAFPGIRGCDCFPPCPYPYYSGSGPLARSWDRLFVRPTSQVSGHVEFETALRAIVLTGHKLERLDVPTGFGVSQDFWDFESPLSSLIIGDPVAFDATELTSLTLRIEPSQHREVDRLAVSEKSKSIEILPFFFLGAPRLRYLELGVGHATDMMDIDDPEQLPMRSMYSVFDFKQRFVRLEVLKLQGIRGSEAQFVSFLRRQPALRRLTLEYMKLAEGSWEVFFDQMNDFLVLQSLELRLELINPDGSRLREPDAWYKNNVAKKIESYVLYGGTNPLRAKESSPVSPQIV